MSSMSPCDEAQLAQRSTQELDADVVEYLRTQPDFFLRHEELAQSLTLRHAEYGTVSLLEYQIRRLRKRIQQLEKQHSTTITIVTKNSVLHHQFSEVQMQLLAASNLNDVRGILTLFAKQQGLTCRVFLLNDDISSNDFSTFKRIQNQRLQASRVYLGRLNVQESQVLFDDPPLLGSFLIHEFGLKGSLGLLCFSSSDGGHFQPDMDTIFIEQLGQVLAYLVMNWAHLSEISA